MTKRDYTKGGEFQYKAMSGLGRMVCDICQEKVNAIDYKEVKLLRKFVSGQFKVIPGKRNRLCPKHQRQIAQSIKNARFMALMPYTRNQTRK